MKHLWLFAVASLIHIALGGANDRGLQEIHLARILKDSGMPNVFPNANAQSKGLFLFKLNAKGEIVLAKLPASPFKLKEENFVRYQFAKTPSSVRGKDNINTVLDTLSTKYQKQFRQFLVTENKYIYNVKLGDRFPGLIADSGGKSLGYIQSIKEMSKYVTTLSSDNKLIPAVKRILEEIVLLRTTELEKYIKVANKLLDIRDTIYSKGIRFGNDKYEDAVKQELEQLKNSDADMYNQLRDTDYFDIDPKVRLENIETTISEQEKVIKNHLYPRNLFYNMESIVHGSGDSLGKYDSSPDDRVQYRKEFPSVCM